MSRHCFSRPAPPPLRLRVLVRDCRGSAALQFALVLPAILLLTLGTIDVGQAMWTQSALNKAVQDAARCASVTPATCGNNTQVQNYAVTRTWGLSVPASTFTFTTPTCGMKVAASYPFTPMTGYVPMSFTLSASACFPNWANATNP